MKTLRVIGIVMVVIVVFGLILNWDQNSKPPYIFSAYWFGGLGLILIGISLFGKRSSSRGHSSSTASSHTPPPGISSTGSGAPATIPTRTPEPVDGKPRAPIFSRKVTIWTSVLTLVVPILLGIALTILSEGTLGVVLLLTTPFWLILAAILFLFLISARRINVDEQGLVNRLWDAAGGSLTTGYIAQDKEPGIVKYPLKPGIRWCVPKTWLPLVPWQYTVEVYKVAHGVPNECTIAIVQQGKQPPSGQTSGPDVDLTNANEVTDPTKTTVGIQRWLGKSAQTWWIHPTVLVVTSERVYGKALSPEYEKFINPDRTPNFDALKALKLTRDKFNALLVEPAERDLPKFEPSGKPVVDGNGKQVTDKQMVERAVELTLVDGQPTRQGYAGWLPIDYDDLKTKVTKVKEGEAGFDDAMLAAGLKENFPDYSDLNTCIDVKKLGKGVQPFTGPRGIYYLHPTLIEWRIVDAFVVGPSQAGAVVSAVGKTYTGTEPEVPVWHRGLWRVGLREGLYYLSPTCFRVVLGYTSVLALDWSEGLSLAYGMDAELSPIEGISNDGWEHCKLVVQVQVQTTRQQWPRVVGRYSNQFNSVNNGIQPVVGSYFRDVMSQHPAVDLTQKKRKIQEEADIALKAPIEETGYKFIRALVHDADLPDPLMAILQAGSKAVQEKATYVLQTDAQKERQKLQFETGKANAAVQTGFAAQMVVTEQEWSKAIEATTRAVALYRHRAGAAAGDELATQLATAFAMYQQEPSIDKFGTALLNIAKKFADKGISWLPQQLVLAGDPQAAISALFGKLLAGSPEPSTAARSTTPTPAPAAQPAP